MDLQEQVPSAPRAWKAPSAWLALLGFVAVLAGPSVYFPLIDNPLIRATAWPTFLLAGAGAALGAYYLVRGRRTWARVLGGVNVALLALFIGLFFGLSALPKPQPTAESLGVAADFTLKDSGGLAVTLSEVYKSNAVLLVFYRGHW